MKRYTTKGIKSAHNSSNPLTIIKAGTGTGKTVFAGEFLKHRQATCATGTVHVLLLPYTGIVKSTGIKLEMPAICEDFTAEMIEEHLGNGTFCFVSTIEGLSKINSTGAKIETLIIDDIHDLPQISAYKRKWAVWAVTEQVKLMLENGGKVVGLTATPQPELKMALIAESPDGLNVIEVVAKSDDIYRTLRWGVGNKDALVRLILERIESGRRVIVLRDNKKSLESLAASLRELGISVQTATSKDSEGIRRFADGIGDVLIGTRIVANAFDVNSAGKDCVAILWVGQSGLNTALLVQTGGRFRDAKSVEYVYFAATSAYFLPIDTKTGKRSSTGNIPLYSPEAGYNRFVGLLQLPPAMPLVVANNAINERSVAGGLRAAIEEMKDYITLNEEPESLWD